MGLKIYHDISGIYNDIDDDNSGNPFSLGKSIIFPIFTQNGVMLVLLSSLHISDELKRHPNCTRLSHSGFIWS